MNILQNVEPNKSASFHDLSLMGRGNKFLFIIVLYMCVVDKYYIKLPYHKKLGGLLNGLVTSISIVLESLDSRQRKIRELRRLNSKRRGRCCG